jgi:hypothetical protein
MSPETLWQRRKQSRSLGYLFVAKFIERIGGRHQVTGFLPHGERIDELSRRLVNQAYLHRPNSAQ